MKVVVEPLNKYELKPLALKKIVLVEWSCILSLVLYCGYVAKRIDISAVQHYLALIRPLVKCLATGNGIITAKGFYKMVPRVH